MPEPDVLAINVRTEIMFAASARDAAAALPRAESARRSPRLPRRSGGAPLLGQTWDWLVHAFDTTVVVEARQDDGPDYVTVVEAGLLAKLGMNSAGVALVTNALVCDADRGAPGVPYHVLLRSILDAEAVADAVATLRAAALASSANYLIGHEDGVALDVEAAPGDFSKLYVGYPRRRSAAAHEPLPQPGLRPARRRAHRDARLARSASRGWSSSSPAPTARSTSRSGPARSATTRCSRWACAAIPTRARHAEPDRFATVAGRGRRPGGAALWLASGNPCEAPFEALDYAAFLSKPLGGQTAAPNSACSAGLSIASASSRAEATPPGRRAARAAARRARRARACRRARPPARAGRRSSRASGAPSAIATPASASRQ